GRDAVVTALAAVAEISRIPSVGEDRADGVLALAQKAGDVAGLVIDAVTVVAPARLQQRVADPRSVDLDLVEPEGGRVERCAHGIPAGERFPEVRAGREHRLEAFASGRFLAALGVRGDRDVSRPREGVVRRVVSDPLRLPVRRCEETHGPGGDRTLRGRDAVLVPHLHGPGATLPAR